MFLFISLAIPCMLIAAGIILKSGQIQPQNKPIRVRKVTPIVYEARSIDYQGIINMTPKRKRIDYKA